MNNTHSLFGDALALPVSVKPEPTPSKPEPKKKLPQEFFAPVAICGTDALAELRDHVLECTTKKMPRWKFSLGQDFVLQIQPKSGGRVEFIGKAVMREGATIKDLTATPEGNGWRSLNFSIGDGAMQVTHCSWHRDSSGIGALQDMRARLTGHFNGGALAEITPEKMLARACLVCGKTLTDPELMARLIGPECAGLRKTKRKNHGVLARNKPLTEEQKAALHRAIGIIQRGEWPKDAATLGPKFTLSDTTRGFAYQHPISGQIVWNVIEANGAHIASGQLGMANEINLDAVAAATT